MTRPILSLSVLSLFFIFSPNSYAKIKDFKVDGQTVKTEVPEGFDALQNIMGTPLALVSKKGAQDRRSVIQIIPYGLKDMEDNLSKMKKDPEEYYSQKEEMLDKTLGESITYEPFEETKKDGATIYSVGMKYKNTLGEFLDKTYYISTKSKELFYIKAVIPLDMENQHVNLVSEVVNSVSAKN